MCDGLENLCIGGEYMKLLSAEMEKALADTISEMVRNAIYEMKISNDEMYLDKKQVCELLNISGGSLYNLEKIGLPRVVLDRSIIRYKKSDVLKWIEKNN
jgi:hypothetical protein